MNTITISQDFSNLLLAVAHIQPDLVSIDAVQLPSGVTSKSLTDYKNELTTSLDAANSNTVGSLIETTFNTLIGIANTLQTQVNTLQSQVTTLQSEVSTLKNPTP